MSWFTDNLGRFIIGVIGNKRHAARPPQPQYRPPEPEETEAPSPPDHIDEFILVFKALLHKTDRSCNCNPEAHSIAKKRFEELLNMMVDARIHTKSRMGR
jgi:hypothetical protein